MDNLCRCADLLDGGFQVVQRGRRHRLARGVDGSVGGVLGGYTFPTIGVPNGSAVNRTSIIDDVRLRALLNDDADQLPLQQVLRRFHSGGVIRHLSTAATPAVESISTLWLRSFAKARACSEFPA